jgi:hypothetical protein
MIKPMNRKPGQVWKWYWGSGRWAIVLVGEPLDYGDTSYCEVLEYSHNDMIFSTITLWDFSHDGWEYLPVYNSPLYKVIEGIE